MSRFLYLITNIIIQSDGASIESPLGPTQANAFLYHFEKQGFSDCPSEICPANIYIKTFTFRPVWLNGCVFVYELSGCGFQSRCCHLENCFCFIDGTVRPICRPGVNQRILYYGHKRVHSIKLESAVIPNGLISNLYDP